MKKQIPFDTSLINTPGITVERRDGVGIDFVKVYGDSLSIIFKSGEVLSMELDGRYIDESKESNLDLLMFREITEMSGEEYARNIYPYMWKAPEDIFTRPQLITAFDAGKSHIKDIHNLK